MTTFVLHGGMSNRDTVNNELFYGQFTALVHKDNVKILLCYWARAKEEWNEKFEREKSRILKVSNKKISVDMVDSPEGLFTKLKNADVLSVSGGEEKNLRPYMSKLNKLKEALEGKVYIGSSMGAFLAAQHYVLSMSSQDTNTVYDGLGLVPYNILCHWDVEAQKDRKISMLKGKYPQTQILLLDEEKFRILKE